ncbi:OmpA/MotB family protein [Aliidiomarina indica]|uniref:OmpA/MotB family protein n=1 Tax=Aliidiomarina indica TaxID=2749147 RepID=UPI00188EAB78|nr:OmpA family protein [Aliidiomarina indica]
MSIFGNFKTGARQDSEHWMGVSDLMAGLMMVFLFISVTFMRYVLIEKDRIQEIAVTYQNIQVAIYEHLLEEFENDLEQWEAEIDRDTLSFEFKSPEVLFAVNQIEIQPRFQEILNDFFPRYLNVLANFEEHISEIRIEGHTDSSWGDASPAVAYFNNMELSQGRTRSVLSYVYGIIPSDSTAQLWVKENVAAVGFSSSRLVLDEYGNELPRESRRVAFRVMTNADTQIRRILNN